MKIKISLQTFSHSSIYIYIYYVKYFLFTLIFLLLGSLGYFLNFFRDSLEINSIKSGMWERRAFNNQKKNNSNNNNNNNNNISLVNKHNNNKLETIKKKKHKTQKKQNEKMLIISLYYILARLRTATKCSTFVSTNRPYNIDEDHSSYHS